jgi:hypothetical protein
MEFIMLKDLEAEYYVAIENNQVKLLDAERIIDSILFNKTPNKVSKTVSFCKGHAKYYSKIEYSFNKYHLFDSTNNPILPVTIVIENKFITGHIKQTDGKDTLYEKYEPVISIPIMNLIFPIEDLEKIEKIINNFIEMILYIPNSYYPIIERHYLSQYMVY